MNEERNRANRLLIDHWTGKWLPIDPIELARAIGVQVEPVAFAFNDDPALHNVSGQYLACDMVSREPTIQYDATEYGPRARFTIAHELGHHVMEHGNRFRDNAGSFSAINYDPVEVSANRFAAELLMPYAVVERFVKDEGITDVAVLADRFDVSQVAMRYRLKNLGLL